MSDAQATELAVAEKPELKLSASASLEEIGARLALVKRALKEAMEKGVDYDQISGCGSKDVLLKPGAEKLKTLFQLGFTVKGKDVRDLGEGHREVEITLQFTHLPTGWLMGDGVGSANTPERRMQREKGGPWDVYNTCLKIAKKRALVDGILTATGSSGLLTQDMKKIPPSTKTAINRPAGRSRSSLENDGYTLEETQARAEPLAAHRTYPSRTHAAQNTPVDQRLGKGRFYV